MALQGQGMIVLNIVLYIVLMDIIRRLKKVRCRANLMYLKMRAWRSKIKKVLAKKIRENPMCVVMGVWWSKIEKVLAKEIETPEDGDHIYTWKSYNSRSHGIYDKGMVIHLRRCSANKKKKYPIDLKDLSILDRVKLADRDLIEKEGYEVASSSIGEFRGVGKVYLFEYGVNPVLFLGKPQVGATCTLFTNTPDNVVFRASYLLQRVEADLDLFGGDSEAFAVYCKTGLRSVHVSWSEQIAASLLATICAVSFLYLLTGFTPASLTGSAALGVFVYCTFGLASDIGARPHVIRASDVGARPHDIWNDRFTGADSLRTPEGYVASIFLILNIWVYLLFAVPECIALLCLAMFQQNFNFRRRWLSNKISMDDLRHGDYIYTWWSKIEKVLAKEIQTPKDGDHIYAWKPDNSKSHGIYDKGMVIHIQIQEEMSQRKVVSTNIDEFRGKGKVYLFEYGVNPVLFLAKPQVGATCILFTNKPEYVVSRASYLLHQAESAPFHFGDNSEDFAVYCKTGLLSVPVSRSEQTAASLLATICAVSFLYLLTGFRPASLTGWAALGVFVYCTFRLASDIGARPHVIRNNRLTEADFLPTQKVYVASIFLVLSIWVYLLFEVPECITLLCWVVFQERWGLSNKISVDDLQHGDHIYTWRGYTYTHHGIYVGDGEVVHAVRGTGPYIHSSSPFRSLDRSVESVNIRDFVCGGDLYRYQYGVNLGHFLAKFRGGTCTLASSNRPIHVERRARFLCYDNDRDTVRPYDLIRNNCEDFAIYCKTGLAVRNKFPVGRSGQIACLIAASGFSLHFKFSYLTSNLIRLVSGYCLYSTVKVMCDTKYRFDTRTIPIERLGNFDTPEEYQSIGSRIIHSLKPVEVCVIILWTLWCVDCSFFRT